LTWQDTAILLRQAISSCWSPEVLAGQFMAIESSQPNVQFVPFLYGTNSRPSQTISELILPIVFLEGIRSLQGVTGDVDYVQNGVVKKGGRTIIFPILGIYSIDVPSVQYSYESSEGVFSPVYTVNPTELPISLVSGFSSAATQIVNLNSTQLNVNLAIWNEYMTNFSANTCSFEALGTDKPPQTLHSIHLTNVCGPFQQDGRKKILWGTTTSQHAHHAVRSERAEVVELKKVMTKRNSDKVIEPMVVAVDPYSVVGAYQTTSQSQILKPTWSNWQNMIVLPTIRNATTLADQLTPTSYLDYSVALNEPYALIQGTGDGTGLLNPVEALNLRHDRWASSMVRNVNTDKSSLEVFLEEEGKKGRGGSLGSLLGGLAGGLLEKWIPGAGQIGGALGGALPF